MRRAAYPAEFLGTFVLVLGGCGSAILAGDRIGFLGVAFAFGLSLLAMAYALGHLSGCHANPAVSLGAVLAGRLTWREFGGYVGAQVLGAVVASWLLYFVATSHAGADPVAAGFAANGYGPHSPGGFDAGGAFVLEVGPHVRPRLHGPRHHESSGSGSARRDRDRARPTLIHLVGIPVTNTSVNPARNTGPATVGGGWALAQLWSATVARTTPSSSGTWATRHPAHPEEE